MAEVDEEVGVERGGEAVVDAARAVDEVGVEDEAGRGERGGEVPLDLDAARDQPLRELQDDEPRAAPGDLLAEAGELEVKFHGF